MTNQPDSATEVAAEPFLRIVGTYPTADGRIQTVELAMNFDLEVDLVGDAARHDDQVMPWFTTFCTAVIAELRACPGTPPAPPLRTLRAPQCGCRDTAAALHTSAGH